MSMSLKIRQALPLGQKIQYSKSRIEEWYFHFGGRVYVSFSGGKDSTVLLHLVRSLFQDVKAVFCDTGLEFPDIRRFVNTVENIDTIKPKIPFNKVLTEYGWPIVSKEQSQFIGQFRSAKSRKTKLTRLDGNKWKRGKISEKWKYLINAPFKISDQCCNIMKKDPFKRYEKTTGLVPFIGTMAEESNLRVQKYNKVGCNAFDAKRPNSTPISFWTEKDIWHYIKENNLEYAEIYNKGASRTGCMFCLY
jgi:3'-phosphoadenosine 5'-phosphosulfate sulfotransferase (PAPS reductase)/FAD synthetase